jgi:NADH-quinone oxidoreductase subunit M
MFLSAIAVVRAYLALFTGARHFSTVSLGISRRERLAVLTLATLVLVGGLFPQPGVASRHQGASEILAARAGHSEPSSFRLASAPAP